MNTNEQHTPEPWRVLEVHSNYVRVTSDTHYSLADTWAIDEGMTVERAEANARRIVACVNACAGIPLEWLESGAEGCLQNVREERDQLTEQRKAYILDNNVLRDDITELTKQRDNLLAALEDAVQEICDWASYADEYYQKKWNLDGKLAKLNAAIASVKGSI